MTSELRECPILRGVGKINGDGWKDTTKKGEVVFVWNAELPAPYSPGQFPRVGCEGWSASVEQYDFAPATASDCDAIRAALNSHRTPDMDGVDHDFVPDADDWYCLRCGMPRKGHGSKTQPTSLSRPTDEAEGLLRECRDALQEADQFIENGIEFGYIQMPDPESKDHASEVPSIVLCALQKVSNHLKATRGDRETVPAAQADTGNAALKARVKAYAQALVNHNEVLRSAYQIATREGQSTNWAGFTKRAASVLHFHHDEVNEALAALSNEGEA